MLVSWPVTVEYHIVLEVFPDGFTMQAIINAERFDSHESCPFTSDALNHLWKSYL